MQVRGYRKTTVKFNTFGEHGAQRTQRIKMNTKKIFMYSLCPLWSIVFFVLPKNLGAQGIPASRIDSFSIHGDIKVTIDKPLSFHKITNIVFYALPNGNSTEQTMGKFTKPADDWHFDIQHIRAQTAFLRKNVKGEDFVVIYLENKYKSWPSWKQKHPDFKTLIPHLVDSLASLIPAYQKNIYLNGHSGGGSFIFGYLSGVDVIPKNIKRISFLDSNYGYDSSYYFKLLSWLQSNKYAALNVFAYNDSIALLNGKSFVSATGGTWYRGHLMLAHFQLDFHFNTYETDSLIIYKSDDKRIQFFFKKNLNRGIYHTQQVELNGFIHSILTGTKYDSRRYQYYQKRAYVDLIQE